MDFKLHADYEPAGDQPRAIEELTRGLLDEKRRFQTLLGVTGSGKTFTMANVVQAWNRPTLVMSHNKTLAAQLYGEFKDFFPENAVHYFVSYYDYYQPEAYIPQRDIYIEKDASINDDLDRLRLAATSSLFHRKDVLIVASVSCIYGLGSPDDYAAMVLPLRVGEETPREDMLARLVELQYQRHEVDFSRGRFRVRGDVVEIFPAYDETAIRVELFGDEVEAIRRIHPLTGEVLERMDDAVIYPAKHFVLTEDKVERAIASIREELAERLKSLRDQAKHVEAQRLEARTHYDCELLEEVGYCPGIENYSRHMSGRAPGEPPWTLLDFFPDDFLLIVDESHVALPQVRGMYAGDQSRKSTLVEHGFRLPSALDNRPLRFEEWEAKIQRCVYVSATPGDYELDKSSGVIVEQIIRPTGLVDPPVEIHPAGKQVPHLLGEVQDCVARGKRALVTTLTKRLAEELSRWFEEAGIKGRYLHSEINTIERVEILNDLRRGTFDVCVGVNLLREGLDLPEVALVAILDADKEGFLRSATSLIQTIGRAARNVDAKVLLYADRITPSMRRALDETNRRRARQVEHNRKHGIEPASVVKALRPTIEEVIKAHKLEAEVVHEPGSVYRVREQIDFLEKEMLAAAERLEFERAAEYRDRIRVLTEKLREEKTA